MDPARNVTGSIQTGRGLGSRSNDHSFGGNPPNESPAKVTGGDLIHPGFNKFCRFVNGYVEGEEKDSSKHNYFCLRDIAKAGWVIYPLLQLGGLVNERVEKLARAWYGACWSIVYSCYRPWKENREKLAEIDSKGKPVHIKDWVKGLYNANEYFRAIMGTIVSAIYGSGAFGMLYAWFKEDDSLFDKAADVYKTGMLNQNQIFASMNAAIVLKRKLIKDGKIDKFELDKVDREGNNLKSRVEFIDTLLFIPNILARGLDTFKMFGANLMNEGLERFVNALGYFSYGTWAARFGIMKISKKEEGGDLERQEDTRPSLYHIQNAGGNVFYRLLPALSWVAAGAELMGLREVAEKTFKLEGICERLNPAVASWCLTDPWLSGYLKRIIPAKTLSPSMSEN